MQMRNRRVRDASLNSHPCPACGGTLILRVISPYVIYPGRRVWRAWVNVCPQCGEHVVTEPEWQHLIEREQIAC